VIGIGVASIIFSIVCGSPFILLVYSEKWASESTVNIMRAYCVNLLFMALNGMAEAFAYGLANQKVLESL
jgi:O-antigen/teichoic acid export membrane protein